MGYFLIIRLGRKLQCPISNLDIKSPNKNHADVVFGIFVARSAQMTKLLIHSKTVSANKQYLKSNHRTIFFSFFRENEQRRARTCVLIAEITNSCQSTSGGDVCANPERSLKPWPRGGCEVFPKSDCRPRAQSAQSLFGACRAMRRLRCPKGALCRTFEKLRIVSCGTEQLILVLLAQSGVWRFRARGSMKTFLASRERKITRCSSEGLLPTKEKKLGQCQTP